MYFDRHFTRPPVRDRKSYRNFASRFLISWSLFLKYNKLCTLKWVFYLQTLYFLNRIYPIYISEYSNVNPSKHWVRLCLISPASLGEFATSIPSKSLGLLIVPSAVTKVCADTDASYNASGLAIRAIRVNYPHFDRNASCASSVNGAPFFSP